MSTWGHCSPDYVAVPRTCLGAGRASARLPVQWPDWFIGRPLNAILGAAFRASNRWFDRVTAAYAAAVAGLLGASAVVLVVSPACWC